MRKLEVCEVRCESCSGVQPGAQWGLKCPACGGLTFGVEIERSSSGIDWGNVFLAPDSGLGNSGLNVLVDVVFDAGSASSSPYYRTDAFLRCRGVSGQDLKDFLEASLDERIRRYISWKRREIESSLAPGHGICLRCQVEFKVYDNEWGRAGLCSKSCHHAFLRSRSGDS